MRKMSARFTFTVKKINSLATPAAGRVHFHDADVRDLGLRIDANGRRTFFWFRKVNRRPTFRALGAFPTTTIAEARGKAHELSSDLDRLKRNDYQGKNPFESPSEEPTLGELVADERRLANSGRVKDRERARKAAQWRFDKYLSEWKNRRVSTIRRKEVIDLHNTLESEVGAHTANRVVQLLKALFNFAITNELWSGVNPAARIKLFPEKSRDRYLKPHEANPFFAALRVEPSGDLADYVRLALFTGARKSDVLAMQWKDITMNAKGESHWRVPAPKSNHPYEIPLVLDAMKILNQRKKIVPKDCDWVFPGRGKTGHIVDLKKRWREFLKRAKLSDFRQHDLRRSLGSWEAADGTSELIVGKSLGHAPGSAATAVYEHIDLAPVREAITSATDAIIAASKRKPRRLAAHNA